MTYNEREYLCNRLVETAMTQEITQEQLAAIHKVIHTMQMKNCAGKETPNGQRFISATRRLEPKP